MQDNSPETVAVRLNAVTRADRFACTAAVRDAIVSSCHGWIGEFYQYSNSSLCLNFEVPAAKLALLRDSLIAAGLNLNGESERVLADAVTGQRSPSTNACTLQITFVHNEPDLRRYVPLIPG